MTFGDGNPLLLVLVVGGFNTQISNRWNKPCTMIHHLSLSIIISFPSHRQLIWGIQQVLSSGTILFQFWGGRFYGSLSGFETHKQIPQFPTPYVHKRLCLGLWWLAARVSKVWQDSVQWNPIRQNLVLWRAPSEVSVSWLLLPSVWEFGALNIPWFGVVAGNQAKGIFFCLFIPKQRLLALWGTARGVKRWIQHHTVPGGPPPQYWAGSNRVNFGVRMRTGALRLIWSNPNVWDWFWQFVTMQKIANPSFDHGTFRLWA